MQPLTPATTLASASSHHQRKKSPWSRSNRSHHQQQKRPWSRSSRSHHHQQKSASPAVLLNKPSQIATLSRRATSAAISLCADAVGGSSSTRGVKKHRLALHHAETFRRPFAQLWRRPLLRTDSNRIRISRDITHGSRSAVGCHTKKHTRIRRHHRTE